MSDDGHVAVECKGCERGCMFCTGGLFACSICGALEGATPTRCPGRQMTADEVDAVYAGTLDFRGDPAVAVDGCSRSTPAYWRTDDGRRELAAARSAR